MYRLALILYSVFISFSLLAQTNFLAKGDASFAEGTYSEAVKQYNAQIAVYDSKEMSKTSEEYVQATRRLSTAQRCQELLSSLTQKFSEARKYGTRQKYDIAIEDARALLKLNPGDKTALECSREYSNIVAGSDANSEWRKAEEENTIEAYRNYLSKIRGYAHRAEAEEAIADLEEQSLWDETLTKGTKEAYQNYLNVSKLGTHSIEAGKKIDRMNGEDLWEETIIKNTQEAYNYYLEHSNRLHEKEAKEALAELEEQAMWKDAVYEGTEESYSGYLNNSKMATHKTEAVEAIERIQDEALWRKTQEQDTEEAYYNYLSDNRGRIHEKGAKAAIDRIADESIWLVLKQQFIEQSFDLGSFVEVVYLKLLSLKRMGEQFDESTQALYLKLKERYDYTSFNKEPSIEAGVAFLEEFPSSVFKDNVSYGISNLLILEGDYTRALQYAISKDDVKQIKKLQKERAKATR